MQQRAESNFTVRAVYLHMQFTYKRENRGEGTKGYNIHNMQCICIGLSVMKEEKQGSHLFPDIVDKGASRGVLHDEVEDVVGKVHVQQADDAGMLQA